MNIQPSQFLADKHYGVKVKGTVYVSPLLWEWLLTATDRELELLMKTVKVLDVDAPETREYWKKKYGKDINVELYGKVLMET